MRLIAAHAGVEEVTDGLELFEAFDHQFRTGLTGRGLDLHVGEAEPALDDSGAEMDVLDAGVSQIDFTAEEDAHLHVDAFVVEAIAKGVIAKEKIWQGSNDTGPGEECADVVILE